MNLLNTYVTSFYGSGLWDLFGSDCDRLYRAWNVAIRQAWGVPNTTHRYFIEPLSKCLHPKVMLACRFSIFVTSLLNSNKFGVRLTARLLSKDLSTVTGRNLQNIARECGMKKWQDDRPLSCEQIKTKMKYFRVPETEEWRLDILSEIMAAETSIEGFTDDEISNMKTYICSK